RTAAGIERNALLRGFGALDLLVVHLDIRVVVVDCGVVGLEVGLGQRLLLTDELLHAVAVGGVILLPGAALRIGREMARKFGGLRASRLVHGGVGRRGRLAERGSG